MMILNFILTQGLIFAGVINAFLFGMMVLFSPRIWGYSDYPQRVKEKVPPLNKEEKRTAWILTIGFLLLAFGYPIQAAFKLKGMMGNQYTFWIGFLLLMTLYVFATIVDTVLLDWLIISKITPKFVIIPGSTAEDYKDFSHHYIGTVKAVGVMIPILMVAALIVWLV